jgi:hypothetical protein
LLAVAASTLALAACGDDGGSNPSPDAQPDAPQRTCTETAVQGALEYDSRSGGGYIGWSQEVSTDLGTGGPVFLSLEFYSEDPISGTIDLGQQTDYATCSSCVLVYAIDSSGQEVAKTFYQDGGTLTLTKDVFTGLDGTATDVSLVEVTINPDTFASTLVPGGTCLSLSSLALSASAAPADWTCAPEKYNDGATCDCACGAHDPDCDLDNPPIAGCTGTQICGSDDTCVDTCDVLSAPAVGCPTGVCGYQSADQDICYTDTTLVDAAALGGTCTTATALFCAVSNTVATGLCDQFEGDDLGCRKACNATADCTGAEVCAPVVGTKGFCITPPINDTCETATALVIGTPANGSTGGAASNYAAGLDAATCTNYEQSGGDVAYTVALTAGQAITVTLSNVSTNFDPSISILGPGTAAACNASPIVCLKGADANLKGQGETFTYTAAGAGVYYIIVDTYADNQGGKFTLNVTSP